MDNSVYNVFLNLLPVGAHKATPSEMPRHRLEPARPDLMVDGGGPVGARKAPPGEMPRNRVEPARPDLMVDGGGPVGARKAQTC